MPKRSNPSFDSSKDEGKRPRTESRNVGEVDEVLSANESFATATASTSPTHSSRTAPNPPAPIPVAVPAKPTQSHVFIPGKSTKETPAGKRNGEPSALSKGGGSLGGNSFLRSLRGAKRSATTPEEKGTVDNGAVPSTKSSFFPPMLGDEKIEHSSNSVHEQNSIKSNDSKKDNVWSTLLVLLLCALVAASATYTLSLQSLHNVAQMRCQSEVEKLKEDLSKNRGVVTVLRSGMDATQRRIEFIEQAHEAKKRALSKDNENGDSIKETLVVMS